MNQMMCVGAYARACAGQVAATIIAQRHGACAGTRLCQLVQAIGGIASIDVYSHRPGDGANQGCTSVSNLKFGTIVSYFVHEIVYGVYTGYHRRIGQNRITKSDHDSLKDIRNLIAINA